jgi:hypothetical protein
MKIEKTFEMGYKPSLTNHEDKKSLILQVLHDFEILQSMAEKYPNINFRKVMDKLLDLSKRIKN